MTTTSAASISSVASVVPVAEPVSCAPAAAKNTLQSLRSRVTRASLWTVVAYVAMQALRLVNSMVIARLLFPQEIGLMMMVSLFMQGLEMFSDIGIGPAIIQNKRGDRMEFLNTAWTMQVGRGFILWIASCVAAWPASVWFNEPRLIWLLPIAGFGSVLLGLCSTSLVYLNRLLDLKKATILEVVRQVITMAVTFAWAVYDPSVWALVMGNFAGIIYETVASHFLIPGHRNRFHWNWDDARSMYRFGRWIFVSTALTFFAMQLDKLLMGKFAGPATLAFYVYAIQLATLPTQFIKKIGLQVAFPMLSEIVRDQPEMLQSRLRLMRLALVGLSVVVLVPMMFAGDLLILWLFGEKFRDAGWMLQILAVAGIGCAVNSTYGSVFFAVGKTFIPMILLASQLILVATAAVVGNYLYGEIGFVIGIALVEWLNYPVTAVFLIRQRLWQPGIDFAAMIACGLAAFIAIVVL